MAPDSEYEVAQCDYPWISVFHFYPFQILAFLSYYLTLTLVLPTRCHVL
jgi:hypothetical protein